MPKYYVLTSNEIPHKCWVFGEQIIDEENGLPLDCGVPYELTEVPSFGSLDNVTVTEKTRFISFLQTIDDQDRFVAETAFHAIIGTPDTTRLTWEGMVYGAGGTKIWEIGDCGLDDFPNILPPEMFGLSSHCWWGNVFDGYGD